LRASMPWKKSLVSEERAQFVLTAKSESESFVSMCGRFGISRKTGYKWLQRYRRGGLKALADVSRRATSPRENAPYYLANAFGCATPGASALGSKKVATAVAKSFSSSPPPSGSEHVGALAGGAALGEEATATGTAGTGVAVEGSTSAKRLQSSVDDRLQRLVSHR